jgi:hypothetical protein
MFKRFDYFFFAAAFISFLFANYVSFVRSDYVSGAFVSLWVPTTLTLGLYFRNINTTSNR